MRLIVALIWSAAALAQSSSDPARFRQAGVCSRCHVAQVLEWSTSKHPAGKAGCQSCHGPSDGHVANERNEVKPDRLPHGPAIAGLCLSCHAPGCPKTSRREACESCHHAHALFNPNQNRQLSSLRFAEDENATRFEAHLRQGEDYIAARNWKSAAGEFEAALRLYPEHHRAAARLALARRRLDPSLPGFTVLGDQVDAETGLPLRVRVTGFPIEMVLVPGGDADIGDQVPPGGRLRHTVHLEPYYLAATELTQSEWALLEPENPSVHRGDNLPVHNVSWQDAEQWIARLNARVPGAGFRLPAEAEWEFAARSSKSAADAATAWFRDNSAGATPAEGFRELSAYMPHPVAVRKPDSRGIYDLAGNVWEWCSTLLMPYPYAAGDGRESHSAPGLRVLRGGGFADSSDYLSPSFRHGERPDRRLPFNGMRLARSVPAP